MQGKVGFKGLFGQQKYLVFQCRPLFECLRKACDKNNRNEKY